jgi:hypothetical protein
MREPEGTRTPNLLIRSQVHYPIMLRVLTLLHPLPSADLQPGKI